MNIAHVYESSILWCAPCYIKKFDIIKKLKKLKKPLHNGYKRRG